MIKRFSILIVVFLFAAGGCKKSYAESVPMKQSEAKLAKAFAMLSEDARNAIPNGDPEEFLADLQKVLDADKEGLLVLCDKTHSLGASYVPKDLVTLEQNDAYSVNRKGLQLRLTAEENLRIMAQAAKKDSVTLLVSSAYRSYDYQRAVYDRLVKLQGREVTDRESARPGTSQHQLGTTVDFGSIDDSFADTKAGRWVNAHASQYGWSLSFPDGYEHVTGYRWESWHFRYIGKEACAFQNKWFGGIQQFMLEFIHAYRSI
ncbi:M15 family metallopeptidase [Treponema parvum]|uniref:M15 family metallopeptidase n=1 Tax=Treponema parvum TaxID=138851 RepID=A0A975IBN8_9SPIR|nr:M15 family metallopeptidase [Treponema parvum]QTQ11206.1 M15 family metallopeptidase [Treponema parvum]